MTGKIITKLISIVLLVTMAGAVTVGCNNKSKYSVEHPKVQIEMDDGGIMVLELYPEYAPKLWIISSTLLKMVSMMD